MLADTADAIQMIKGYDDFLSEELLLQTVDIGQGIVRESAKRLKS